MQEELSGRPLVKQVESECRLTAVQLHQSEAGQREGRASAKEEIDE